HPAVGVRRDPANIHRDKSTEAANLADHQAGLHGVDPDRGTINTGHGWFEAGKEERNDDQRENRDADDDDAFTPFLPGSMRARNIHRVAGGGESGRAHNSTFDFGF